MYVLSEIQRQVRTFVCGDIKNGEEIQNSPFQAEIELIEKQLKQLDLKRTSLFEGLADGKLSKENFKQITIKLTEQKKDLESKKILILQKLNTSYEVENNLLKDLGKYAGVQELTWSLVSDLIQTIKVFPDNSLEIVWNFKDLIKN